MKVIDFRAVELDPEEIFYEYKIEYNTQILYCIIPVNDILKEKIYKDANLFVYNKPSNKVTVDNEEESIVYLPKSILEQLYYLCVNYLLYTKI